MYNKNQLIIILLFASVLSIQTTQAQTDKHFDTFCHWLAGTWYGEGFGGITEEVWAPPVHGEMVGTFRHFDKKEKTTFYEFFRMDQQALQLKHFSPSFEGWEDKKKYVSFPFVKATAQSLVFEGIRYLKKGPHTLEVILQRQQEGKLITTKFIFKRRRTQ
ncbi:MAG TPA: hypothetical protein DCS93_21390 [Microscillaceae bacterium]|nr:hypothetical protein [Microscillaceae bacterium]